MSQELERDELLDLLAENATCGLDEAGAARLEALLAASSEQEDHFSAAAAALELAAAEAFARKTGEATGLAELPPAVENRLRREARRFSAGLPPSSLKPVPPLDIDRGRRGSGETAVRGGARPAAWLPWLVAAILFVAAATGWWRVFLLSRMVPAGAPIAAAPAGVPPSTVPQDRSPALARAALLASSSRAVPVPWTPTPDPAAQGVTGDVVWSAERQNGFLRFQNLPTNDPAVYQYQLWIFDATRDERFPIDGGVFDVPAGGEVVIPIEAKLKVGQATLFAVTIEKPGGTVVSSRDRIVVLAQVI